MSHYPLNQKQQAIVNHIDGALLLLAPVGTGKTSVLSQRVSQAITQGVSAERILCLTFTNRAAKEMGDRLAKAQPQQHRDITVKTFHSLCASILRIEARYAGLPADFVVYDDSDCFEIIKNLSKRREQNKNKDIWDLVNAIADCKAKADQTHLTLDLNLDPLFSSLSGEDRRIANLYQKTLNERHAIDFTDLVFYTRALLFLSNEVLERWRNRFDFIQVDEVQDTHLTEYEVVSSLAFKSGQLALIGDLDQTIYEWRGSDPNLVLQQFEAEFSPTIFKLELNYRATKSLLNTASSFADYFGQRHTRITPAPECLEGEATYLHHADCEDSEAKWIGEQINLLDQATDDFHFSRTAILARTNKRAKIVANALSAFNIPCITVEQYEFFKRGEIKDALAYLKFVTNSFDTGAFKRLMSKPDRGISIDTLRTIYTLSRKPINEKEPGFRLTDFASTQSFLEDDPLGNLIESYKAGTVIVFDVETTGIAVSDEVIEVAAIKLLNGQQVGIFREYISDAVGVGSSTDIHGYSDEFLRQKGKPAYQVFSAFCTFSADAMLIGHNVGFDINMVTAHAQKVGITVPSWKWADTWNLSQRFLKADSYSLAKLAIELKLPSTPNHQALDDVRTTVELLDRLIPLVENGAVSRKAIANKYRKTFEPLSEDTTRWKGLSQTQRPAQLLADILETSGLKKHYEKDLDRSQNLQRLVSMFQDWDDTALHSDTALRHVLERAALAKNLDQLSEQDNQIVVITAHQSKGLEFDNVFIAGVSDEEFPFFLSVQDGNIEEEKRLFYVAITRAKERLFVSCSTEMTQYGKKYPSRFFQHLPKENATYSKAAILATVAS